MNLMSFEGIIFDSFKSILWNSRNKLSPNQLLFGSSDQTNTNDETELIIDALNQCTEKQRRDAYALLKLFLTAIR